mgnify:FL=1
MSTFLSKEDYRASIKSYRFDQLLADEEYSPEDVMDDAESEAIATVKDALFGYYDVDTIFAATGELGTMY